MVNMALRVAIRNGFGRLRGVLAPSSLQSRHLLHHSTSAAARLPPFSPLRITPVMHYSVFGNMLQRFGISSSASPQATEKHNNHSSVDQNPIKGNDVTSQSSTGVANAEGGEVDVTETTEKTDAESDLSVDDLVKLVAEKEELVNSKQKEIEQLKDKVLRSYAEMENVIDRTKREAENSKKFAIQNFAKSLLDVADNLGRASSVVKDSFQKIDPTKDSSGAVPLLKTLLEGVEMTDKQLIEVLRKFGVEKFEPIDESFDPNRHNAVFQVPDASKPPGTVAVVLKSGYTLYDRIIRPAEVGVTAAAPGNEAE
ncbi:grpE protein homolog 2, mitochondrial-like isoform X2 [Nymphaea colorata]|uniref:grpE protein homolog 2, mitochondrial-like isoform X2 n=1 Tax=Nymphaea colorata TaxID=210225 RepID=UPI00129EE0DB|nr:grpE protein homolog 2, mitochondrial-like isoform X2 [Nymphaea colorata]